MNEPGHKFAVHAAAMSIASDIVKDMPSKTCQERCIRKLALSAAYEAAVAEILKREQEKEQCQGS